jgi:predicted nucleotidyltransferase
MTTQIEAKEVTAVVRELVEGAQRVLGDQLVGAYVTGSLTTGEFDEASDIDVVIVTTEELDDARFDALELMHEEISRKGSRWANQLEVSYFPRADLRRYDPGRSLHPRLDRGKGERLKMMHHDSDWVAQRHMLREKGLTLIGPDPKKLIDPVSPDELREAMRPLLLDWMRPLLDERVPFAGRGHQAYIVLTVCRILYTMEHGEVVSKREAAKWAQENMHDRWQPLIERAWRGRQSPSGPMEDANETIAFIRQIVELM